jgi:hypothetical protein
MVECEISGIKVVLWFGGITQTHAVICTDLEVKIITVSDITPQRLQKA